MQLVAFLLAAAAILSAPASVSADIDTSKPPQWMYYDVTKYIPFRDCVHKAVETSMVRVNYTTYLWAGKRDGRGKKVESTKKAPAEFLRIRGLADGIVGMCEGEERTLVIPPDMAWGTEGNGKIPPGAALVYDIKLLEITNKKVKKVEVPQSSDDDDDEEEENEEKKGAEL
ncbi:Peptidyl-prolyl cis-trans isomerase fpr2 [Podochytrium sp. JEL0797]|nr:Peptidyl-prolyl cis-trans isomerase fpr2 [Podochytrium sp. JEL0797]